ncbi:MAG: hypothetical protein J2P24_09590 [Streptosporangiales bacterium]|nr:hypothetical protein [Streptosporangiales bacterium]
MRRSWLVSGVAAAAVVAAGAGFLIGYEVVPDRATDSASRPAGTAVSPTPERPSASTVPSVLPLARPWPDRPVVRLSYDVAADHRSVSGVEDVTFTPDRKVCGRLVFRAWPNKPGTALFGGSLTIHRVSVGGRPARPAVHSAGGVPGRPGTLVDVPLRDCVAAGHSVAVRLSFDVVMATGSGERVGTNRDGEMWFASAFPVLAWERGHGWMTDSAVDVFGESDGSEEFKLALDVVAPGQDSVLGTGRALPTTEGPRPDTVRHRFAADSVRNVAVAVGGYRLTDRVISGVRVHVGVSDNGAKTGAQGWLAKIELEIPRLERYFGRFPYDDLWVTVIPDTTGIEFPGAIFYGDTPPSEVGTGDLVGHELAHMWFYSLVGDDQGRDPWLDEAFAQYGQALADGREGGYLGPLTVPPFAQNRVGAPMTYWARDPNDYGIGVYRQGAHMLFEARTKAGPARWDAAIRTYIARNAHRIARPSDLEAAVRQLPGAVETLRAYGAVRS